jgi:hypothetical protein
MPHRSRRALAVVALPGRQGASSCLPGGRPQLSRASACASWRLVRRRARRRAHGVL